jgi:endogenous inhibitor of DNA gyrase (YacG/DUF329 family)
MIKVRCPICSKRLEIEAIESLPSFPFCSDRCKLVDLGRWIDGTYMEAVIKANAKEGDEGNGDGAVAPPEEDDEDALESDQ